MKRMLLFAGLLLLCGCSSGPKIVPVSGEVLIDGNPVPQGFVQVTPEGFRPATGKIENGKFTLTTLKPNDGCAIGTHPVVVIGTETLGPSAQKWHAPKDYASPTSGLKVTIDGPTDNLKIELTWAGGKPFVEQFNKE